MRNPYKWAKEIVEVINSLKVEGYSDRAIARELDWDQATFRQRIKKLRYRHPIPGYYELP